MAGQHLAKLLKQASQVVRLRWQERLPGGITCIYTESLLEGPYQLIVGTNTGEIVLLDEEGRTSSVLKLEGEQITWVVACDVDADDVTEVLVGTQTGQIVALTRNSNLRWRSDVGDWVDSIFVACPGITEDYLLAGTEKGLICALDKRGSPLWVWETGHNVLHVEARDLDGDGDLETIASSRDGGIYIFHHDQSLAWTADCRGWLTALHTADVDNDGLFEIATGGWDRTLFLFSPSGELTWSYTTSGWIADIDSADLTGNGMLEFVVGSRDGCITILSHDGRLIWTFVVEGVIKGVKATVRNGGAWITVACENGRLFTYDIRLQDSLREEIESIVREDPDVVNLLEFSDVAVLSSLFGEDLFQRRGSESLRLSVCEQLLAEEEYGDLLAVGARLARYGFETLWTHTTPETMDDVYTFDIDNNGEVEVVAASGDGTVWALDCQGEVLWHFDPHEVKGMWSVHAEDLDEDGRVEIVAGCKSGVLYVLSPDGEPIRTRSNLSGIRTLDVSSLEDGGAPKLILGCEKHCVHLLNASLDDYQVFPTEGWVRSVCAADINGDGSAEILASARDGDAYLFNKSGQTLWRYKTYDWARTALIADVDADGHSEAIVGCGNGSVYCLNRDGQLKWLYKFDHRVDAIYAAEFGDTGQMKIFVGTESGDLAVLTSKGDLDSLYPLGHWVRSLHGADLTRDGRLEIVGASADCLVFALTQVDRERLARIVDRAWEALAAQHGGAQEVVQSLLRERSSWKQIAGLMRIASSDDIAPDDFLPFFRANASVLEPEVKIAWLDLVAEGTVSLRVFEEVVKLLVDDESFYVRSKVAQVLSQRRCPDALRYLRSFTSDARQAVRSMAVKSIGDIHVHSVDISPELIAAVSQDPSEWVRSEAARALARYLDQHPHKLLELSHCLLRENVEPEVFCWLGNMAHAPCVSTVMQAYHRMLTGPALEEVQQILSSALTGWQLMMEACEGVNNSTFLAARTCYRNLRALFEVTSIATVIPVLNALGTQGQPRSGGLDYLPQALTAFQALRLQVNKYLNREALGDRLAALLDAVTVLEGIQSDLAVLFAVESGRSAQFPERYLFELAIQHLREVIKQELQELRGRAELELCLNTKTLPKASIVTIALSLRNIGKSPAENVRVFLEAEDYEVVGNPCFPVPLLPSQAEVSAEFTVRPSAPSHRLVFRVEYEDAASLNQVLEFADRVALEAVSQPFERLNNPYMAGLPINDPDMFFGRQDIIQFLKSNFTGHGSQNVIVLHGQRRTGKTSVLFQLRDVHLELPNIPVYIDMQSFMDFTSSRLFYKIARQITQALRRSGIEIAKPRLRDYQAEPTLSFDEFLDDLEFEIGDRKLVLLIDEFEILEVKVKAGLISQDVFGYFRSLMQHRRFFGFVFAGTHTLQLMSQTYWSVFFNIALHQRVSFLDSKSATALITQPLRDKLTYDSIAIEKIKTLTGNHPYFIQLLCRSLVYHCNQHEVNYVTLTDVNAVLRQVLDTGQDHFQFVWQNSSMAERLLLAVIAHQLYDDLSVASLHDVFALFTRHGVELSHAEVKEAIQKLMYRDLVVEVATGQQYKLTIGLIRLWLREVKSLKHVVLEYQTSE